MHEPLTKEILLPRGPLQRLGREAIMLEQVDSTNAYLLERAAGLPDGAIACAEFQTAGRGRLGRRWESPRGSSVLLSVLLKEPAASPLAERATLVAVLAACEAVEHATLCRPAIRWPNDLTASGRKLGGVLVESTPLAAESGTRAIVIGIGINCLQHRGHFGGDLSEIATSLEIESSQPVDRAAVACRLVECLDGFLATAVAGDEAWSRVLADWKARCEDVGRRVTLRADRQTFTGTVVDISSTGDLLVQLDTGGRRYFASATTTRVA